MNKSVKEVRAGLIPSEETENLPVVTLRMTYREYDTMLAALRLWQAQKCKPFAETLPAHQQQVLLGTASDHGSPLADKEIDQLIQRVQFDNKPKPLPIIVMEGGLVQDVFIPIPDGKGQPYTDVSHELFDYDIFDGSTDDQIVWHWNQLSDEAKTYFKKHVPEAWEPVRKAVAREKRRARKAAK
jgi:hypothetical protein